MVSLKVKELLCLFYSGLLFISGLLLIGYSVFLSYKVFYHFKFMPSSSIGPFVVFFILGFIHLFATWLGVKGPTREHDWHIFLFVIITVALLVSECALGVWSVILCDEVDIKSLELMTESFSELLSREIDKKDWESLETKLKCCGLDGAKSYSDKKYTPWSCFHNETTSGIFVVQGCKKPFANYAKSILIDGAIMGFSCSVFQAFGIFAFYVFFRALRVERSARAQRRIALQRSLSQENGANSPPSPPTAPPTSA